FTDAFVTKLNSSGTALVYSTFLGGNSEDFDLSNSRSGIAVDASGNAYVTGSTYSNDFPTVNALQGTNGGGFDAFVTKLNSSGAVLYSTFLGGGFNDQGFGIAVDASGKAYVTGITYSTNFPTANAFDSTFSGFSDAFVTKLNSSGT